MSPSELAKNELRMLHYRRAIVSGWPESPLREAVLQAIQSREAALSNHETA